MKKFFKTKVGKLLKGWVGNSLQTLPFVGTVVTVFKSDTPKSPKGKLNFEAWDIYRMVLALVAGFFLMKELLTEAQIVFLYGLIGF